jgi:acetoin utilization deacetylase AcuC-like enzyme
MISPGKETAFFSSTHKKHIPPFEIWNGTQDEHQEIPERAENILAALRDSKVFELQELNQDMAPILLAATHSPRYLQFLREASASLSEDQYQYPSVFAIRDSVSVPTNSLAQQGYYSFDMYTPISGTTYEAALRSASLAHRVAVGLVKGEFKVGYALCRPPGHHAERSQMGGYCYLNNAAIAADYLAHHGKVATLDVDFHHGNGTQHIYAENPDVLTISLHADPDWKFPHMSGFADERGIDDARGTNINYPLPKGTTDDQFQLKLLSACKEIARFSPQHLVVSFGADTFVGDPIGGFTLTSDYFTEMGRTIDSLDLPTAIVQEGGYNTEELGTNVVNFLGGFK